MKEQETQLILHENNDDDDDDDKVQFLNFEFGPILG
jgi:hypothetical protein